MARRVGIIMNGVTGRMGMNQHLIRSILAIRAQGGLPAGGDVIWPEPLLVGRSEAKLAALAAEHGLEHWTTDLDAALADPAYEIYFDAQLTSARPPAVEAAIAAGKHVYCEKPVTPDVETALALARAARDAGVKVGVVQDKLFLPGLLKLQRLVASGYLRTHHRRPRRVRLLGVSGAGAEAAAAVVELPLRGRGRHHQRHVRPLALRARQRLRARALGAARSARRTSRSASTRTATPYDATAEDAAYAMFEFDGGAVVQLNSSWCVRVQPRRAVRAAGRRHRRQRGRRAARVQGAAGGDDAEVGLEPRPAGPDRAPRGVDRRARTTGRSRTASSSSGSTSCATWCDDEPFPWDFLEGARGVQLAELGEQSWRERRWIDVPELTL